MVWGMNTTREMIRITLGVCSMIFEIEAEPDTQSSLAMAA